ncbi:uncharacterized protein F4807DRAFT_449054 [Annulohypoxylon truncatum]|uniref:uncharacterized protein n=1 Tax=Annulohypoxylon truncatum TaxID=327061 RepID=UPI0020076C37|nr:uncharacterized protein F4807DRAFT_449054 [Annulohypoxylon truncatum]KAI1204067.1 hypothetical protein F4807DRAFT_449054 [Annulohypoxylon truncatum]
MKHVTLAILFAAIAVGTPISSPQPRSLSTIENRDGTTQFDPDFGLKAKAQRDGTTQFDPDFGLKA